MRFNDRELIQVAERTPVIEGMLRYLKPQGNDWSDWYAQPVYKERVFKLVNNLLFYFRAGQPLVPIGLLVLENVQVAYEPRGHEFAFSLMLSDGKHIFSCRCQDDVNRWVSALKTSSYQYWRSLYTILQAKINMKNGREPMLNVMKRGENKAREVPTTKYTRSTFYGYTEVRSTMETTTTSTVTSVNNENLIEL